MSADDRFDPQGSPSRGNAVKPPLHRYNK